MDGSIIVLGIDPGTANLGYAALLYSYKENTASVFAYGVITTHKWNEGTEVPVRDRIDSLGRSVLQLIASLKLEGYPIFVAIEDFVEQGKLVGKTYKEMAALTEHLRTLVSTEAELRIYSNRAWKLNTIGIGTANKAQIKHYVQHHIDAAPLNKEPSHVWDSVCIAYSLLQDIMKRS